MIRKLTGDGYLLLAGAVTHRVTIGSGFTTRTGEIDDSTYCIRGAGILRCYCLRSASSTTITTLPRPEQRHFEKEMTYISFTAVIRWDLSWIIILLYFVTCHFRYGWRCLYTEPAVWPSFLGRRRGSDSTGNPYRSRGPIHWLTRSVWLARLSLYFCIGIGVVTLFRDAGNVGAGLEVIRTGAFAEAGSETIKNAGPNWVISALSYADSC